MFSFGKQNPDAAVAAARDTGVVRGTGRGVDAAGHVTAGVARTGCGNPKKNPGLKRGMLTMVDRERWETLEER